VIALDTNILVYARRQESEHHKRAAKILLDLAEGTEPWALAWPCVYEFVRVVTHSRVFSPPSKLELVLKDLEALFQSPTITLLGEGPSHPTHLDRVCRAGAVSGNIVHDAHIAALLVEHGVREFLTADRDFSRFTMLNVRDPFVH